MMLETNDHGTAIIIIAQCRNGPIKRTVSVLTGAAAIFTERIIVNAHLEAERISAAAALGI
jgi:hypothetical protein